MAITKRFEHLKIRLDAIKAATNDFARENCIGKGGFGKVYKGELVHSEGKSVVAIKRLDPQFGQGASGQGNPQFWTEITMLSLYKHENIVSLLGFCDENDEKILVYEYASKGSLDFYISHPDLSWIQRLQICIKAAHGLAYLHNPGGSQQSIWHRDIKSSNILLEENWNARVSDFGLSKFGPANQQYSFLISRAVGTHGYCDPLYVEDGILTKESDVYSFGVVLFEILCGRLCIVNNKDTRQPLIRMVRQHYAENRMKEIVYGNMRDEINPKSLEVFTSIAYQCLDGDRGRRPLVTQVVSMLKRAFEYQVNAMVVDIKPKFLDGGDKIESWNLPEIVDSSDLKNLKLPDTVADSKVMQLIYTNSGLALLALWSNGIHKLWKWRKNADDPSEKSTASVVPLTWQPKNGVVMSNHISESKPAEESPGCIALPKNDFFVLSASGGKVSLFNMMTFKVLTTFMVPPPAPTCLAMHPQDSNIVAIGRDDSRIEIYNVRFNMTVITLEGHQKQITGIAFSQYLKSLVSSGADAQLCVWNMDGWEKQKSRSLRSPPGYPSSLIGDTKVQYHKDQRHLLVVHESQIAIYDPQLECLKSWSPRESLSAPISTAAYSFDGQLLFTGFLDGAVGIFDGESLRLQCRISPSAYISPSISSSNPTAYPMIIAAHPSDPNQFALGMSDGLVHVIEPGHHSDHKSGCSSPQKDSTLASSGPSEPVL